LAVAGVLVASTAWILATPVFAFPDEPAHLTRAAAVVDGQVIAPDKPVTEQGWAIIWAPDSLARSMHRARCLWSGVAHPNVPASCVKPLPRSHRMIQVPNAAGRYEPAYYAVIGWPLLWAPTVGGVYAARAVNAALCILLLAFAIGALGLGRRGPPWWRVGLLTALTPFVLYIGTGINPSSWEICAAVATWAGVLRLCADGLASRAFVIATTIAAGMLAISRPLGPLWLLFVAVVAVAITPRPRMRVLVGSRTVQVGLVLTAAACAVSLMWTVTQINASFDTQPLRHPVPFGSAFGQTFTLLPRRLEELVAVFGFGDVPVPLLTVVVWTALTAVIVGAALWRGRGRGRWTLLALAVVTILVPALIEAHMATRIGMVWQGRYTLPLAVGVPLLAGQVLEDRTTTATPPRWLLPAAAGLAGLAQVAAFVWALRRYEHGVPGSLNPFTGAWLPPGGPILAIALFTAGITALCIALATTPRAVVAREQGPANRYPQLASGEVDRVSQ
jgi:hypothetical protein